MFDLQLLGEYKLTFLEVQLITDNNAKIINKSFIDYFKGLFIDKTIISPLWILPIDPVNDYTYANTKPYANNYLKWGPQGLIDPQGQWYGEKTLWSVQIDSVIPRHYTNTTTP